MGDNLHAVEKIKKLTKSQKSRFTTRRNESSSSSSYLSDVRSDEYQNLLEKVRKLETHMAECAEKSSPDSVKDYHLCRLDNIHLEHQNRSLKQLLMKIKSLTGIGDEDLTSLKLS